MKRLIFALCAIAVVTSVAFADVPDASKCSCTLDASGRLLLVPSTTVPYAPAAFTLTIRNNANNPINNCTVVVNVGGIADNKTHLCPSAVTTGTTNSSGIVTFTLVAGGGCFKGTDACVITGNGQPIRTYGATVSPDYAAHDNSGVAAQWNLAVNLVDFSQFGAAFTAGGPSCHDYDNNGVTALVDFAVFGGCWLKTCN